MCGIYGVIAGQRKLTRPDVVVMRELFTELAVAAASRGTDAAGFAAISESGRALVHKTNKSSVAQVEFGVWQDALQVRTGRLTRALLGHTRLATHGANIPLNAHPFRFPHASHGELIGTHNGIIWNDEQLYPFRGRAFDCDSANLFAFLAQKSEREWADALGEVTGGYALAMQRRDTLYFVRNDSSPCVFAQVPALGLLAYASTEYILQSAAKQVGVTLSEWAELPTNKLVVMDLYGNLRYTAPTKEAEDPWATHMLAAYTGGYRGETGASASDDKTRNWKGRREWHKEFARSQHSVD